MKGKKTETKKTVGGKFTSNPSISHSGAKPSTMPNKTKVKGGK